MHTLLRTSIVTLLLTAPAWAANPTVGQEAPELGSANWVLNEPGQTSIAALRGEVVFVEKWGVKCPPCVALIPHIEQLQRDFGDRGLHIFTFEAQNHTPEQVRAKIAERGGETYPVSAGGGNNYQGDGTIPVAWLIGVDGKVIWQGNPSAERQKLDQLIAAEVAKVRFPGLGKQDVDPAVLDAVKAYMAEDLASAREEAHDVLGDDDAGEAARADAQYLIDKIAGIADTQWSEIEAHQSAGRFLEAYELADWYASAFKGADEGERAKDLVKQFKRDKTLKKELKAAAALAKLLEKLEGQPAEIRAEGLRRFAESRKYEGTAAARRASEQR